MAKVGFIGLGTMGLPMARNLLKGGHDLQVFDISQEAITKSAADGARPAGSPAGAADGVEFVITMLPNAPHVRTALFENGGAAGAMGKDTLLIDMSTIHPLESDAIAETLAAKGIQMIDAPVGRTSRHAELGTLLIMAGGDAKQIERAQPLLSLMGDTIVHCGKRGSGARMKVVNNFMSTALNVLSAEALTLAGAVGLDIKTAIEVMMSTPAGQGHFGTTYAAKALVDDFTPGFMVDLAHKDLGLALDLAASMNVPVPVGAVARETYSRARRKGLGRKDWTILYAIGRDGTNE